jgi:hypothetical protein
MLCYWWSLCSNLAENIDPVLFNTGTEYISYAANMKIQLKQKYDGET